MSDDRFVEIIFLHYSSLNFIPRLSRQSNVQIIRISCVKTFSVCSASVSLRDVGLRDWSAASIFEANSPFDSSGGDKYIH